MTDKQFTEYCNTCGSHVLHRSRHSHETAWKDEETFLSGAHHYSLLECCGCRTVQLVKRSWVDDHRYLADDVVYYPPREVRRQAPWVRQLWSLGEEDRFVSQLLKEIYLAVQNDQRRLAAMGVRALLEQMMITETGADLGTFQKNLDAFEERTGHLSRRARDRLEQVLNAGHAAIHRKFEPSSKDMDDIMDITEHLIQAVYLHDDHGDRLKRSVPPRPPREKAPEVTKAGAEKPPE